LGTFSLLKYRKAETANTKQTAMMYFLAPVIATTSSHIFSPRKAVAQSITLISLGENAGIPRPQRKNR
jgi:hypothetical protein